MASPDVLRLYFGKNAPAEVLDIIFEYGWHLWFAKPRDAAKYVKEDNGDVPECFWTTRHLVDPRELSTAARKLVDFTRYWLTMGQVLEQEGVQFLGLARPRTWDMNPVYMKDGSEWFVVHYCDPQCWNAARFPLPPQGSDDDAEP